MNPELPFARFSYPSTVIVPKLSVIVEAEVLIATAGVSIGGGEEPDEAMLKKIATENLYVPITRADVLVEFISAVGSSGASTSGELRNIIDDLESLRQMDIDEEAADDEDGDER